MGARVGRHQISVTLGGRSEDWIAATTRILELAVELEQRATG